MRLESRRGVSDRCDSCAQLSASWRWMGALLGGCAIDARVRISSTFYPISSLTTSEERSSKIFSDRAASSSGGYSIRARVYAAIVCN